MIFTFGIGGVFAWLSSLLQTGRAAASAMPVEQASPPTDTPTRPRFAKGIDVSLHQGVINWDIVASSGVDFAIIKTTQYGFAKKDPVTGKKILVDGKKVIGPGRGVDPRFRENQIGARRTMKRVGYYHWMEPQFSDSPNGDGASQADYFVKTVGSLQPGEFLALDLENRGLTAGVVVPQMRAFLERLELLTSRRPYIYTNSTFPYKLGDHFADYPLWIVYYLGLDKPRLPAGWNDWKIWQYTDKGSVPGISGGVDMDAASHDWVKEK